jgi:hypothetical protein
MSRYKWSLFGGTKVAEIYKKEKKGKKKIADLHIDKVKNDDKITNPALKNVHSREKLEQIINTSKLSKKKKKELLDSLDITIGGSQDNQEVLIEGKSLKLPNNQYSIKPIKMEYDGSDRECVYITGASGTGKSQWISDYLRNYKEKYPEDSIVVFSSVDEDKCIDEHNPIRINLEELVDNPITDLKELANTCCIFDDTASIPDKQINKAVQKIRDMILEHGRHDNISCLTTSHIPMDGVLTKYPIREAQKIVVFPEGNEYPTQNLLEKYCGLKGAINSDTLNKMISREYSRWGCISRKVPKYVLFKRSALIL